MAQPTPYDRQANFSNEEALNPTTKTPGTDLDSEFNSVKVTLDETLANLAQIQRDDGQLANGIVTSDSLAASLSIGFTLLGDWEAGFNYALNDGVVRNSRFYRAKSSHLSSTGNGPVPEDDPDYANRPWTVVADFTEALDASNSAAAAALSASQALTYRNEAATLIGGTVTAAVRWDTAQSLTDPQKAQARSNIDVRSTATSLGLAQAGLRNLLINPSFRINQRGFAGGALSAGVYGHDRWKAGASGGSYSVSAGVATISSGSIVQVVEGASIEFDETYVLNWTGTATCAVNGVSKTKGAALTLTAGSNVTIEFGTGTLSQPQLEAGSIPTGFERRSVGFELNLCLRYFEMLGGAGSGAYEMIGVGAAAASSQSDFLVGYSRKRANPTVTLVGSVGDFFAYNASPIGTASTLVPVTGSARPAGANLRMLTSGLTTGQAYLLAVTNGSRISVDAEL